MKNAIGNPARGEAFYQRNKEIKKIYEILNSKTSIYLAAPRRVGKTSILMYLEDNPKPGFTFIYIITESVYDKNEFYKIIFEEVLGTDVIKGLAKASAKFQQSITGLLDKVKNIKGVELREGQEPDYYKLIVELFSHVSDKVEHIVIMVDEFPQTIQNILDKEGSIEAQNFIQSNRQLRHEKNLLKKVSFIYTGSVSLLPLVEKITELTAINDLRTLTVEPLSETEAKDFITALLVNYNIRLNESTMTYTLNKIRCFIPFHIQLMVQEIIDVHESAEGEIDNAAIDKAFEQVVHIRNKPQFEPYFSRLKKIFKDGDHAFVMELLQTIAIKNEISKATANDLAVKHGISNFKFVIETLEGDGYIFKEGDNYYYVSPFLQSWCKKHICQ